MDACSFYSGASSADTPQNRRSAPTRQSSTSSESSKATASTSSESSKATASTSSESSKATASSAQRALKTYSAVATTTTAADTTTRESPDTSKSNVPSSPRAHQLVDALEREYPKPTKELDLCEALSRKPGRWTLAHYIKETPMLDFEEAQERARERDATKAGLQRAKEEIRNMTLPN